MATSIAPLFIAPAPVAFRHAFSPQLVHRPPCRPASKPVMLLRWLFPPAANHDRPIPPPVRHAVLPNPPAKPKGGWQPPLEEAMFGLGCFWGAERKFYTAKGVHTTSVGYAGGSVENPTYRAVCSGRTAHNEVVNVVFDSSKTSYEDLLDIFWEAHDPTTKNRQGNDIGTQYRSGIYFFNAEQKRLAEETKAHFDGLLQKAGGRPIVTEITAAPKYYFAEEYHQQYLHKNPLGYCGLGGTALYRPRERAQQ